MYKNLTYRFIDNIKEKDKYVNFVKSFPIVSKTEFKNVSDMIEETISYFSDEWSLHAGAFDGDTLVASTSGHYLDFGETFWYSHSQFSKLKTNSLFLATDFMMVTLHLQKMLYFEAEKNHVFNYYTRRRLKQQLTIEKLIKWLESKDQISLRYHTLYDGLYLPGKDITVPNHKFYKPIPDAESLILLHVLKQEEREKLLNLNKI